jgi:hypothetical protein
MSLIPVGKKQVMRGQQVRDSYVTDLSSLLKFAQNMPPVPPKKVDTEEVDAAQAGNPVEMEQQDTQAQPQPQQQGQTGPGGSFLRPGAEEQQAAMDKDDEQVAAQQQKEGYRTILSLQKELIKKLQEKNLKNTKITVETSPKQMLVRFDASHKINVGGNFMPAEQALEDVIEWAQIDKGMKVSFDIHGGSSTGRDIERVDPNERVNYSFSYTPQIGKNEKNQPKITEMDGQAQGQSSMPAPERGNSRMGVVPGQEEAGSPEQGMVAAASSNKQMVKLPPTLPEMMAARRNDLASKMASLAHPEELKDAKASKEKPLTMAELVHSHKDELVQALSHILSQQAGDR